MQIVIKESNQIALIAAIAKWQENEAVGEYSVFITAIMFFPYYNGFVTAVVNYNEADSAYTGNPAIIVTQQQPSTGATSEKSVFSAMQGGTDGG